MVPFSCRSPAIDESLVAEESPEQAVMRLARTKAASVAKSEPAALVIGSDQVAVLAGRILGKPGNHAAAVRQLSEMSGHCVRFFTGLCLLNTLTSRAQVACVLNDVHFLHLTQQQIERYLNSEQPYQCAGSFKSEALGISLLEKIEGPDPTALIGLPLIKLCEMLRNENYNIP
jgi:septum formation protein